MDPLAESHVLHQLPSDTSRSFHYYRYELAAAVPCDLEFRKFMACSLSFVHVIPNKTGPTLKLTQKGVVQVPYNSDYPLTEYVSYKGVPLFIEQITFQEYELQKKETQTKIYFTGFPVGTSVQDVELTFNRFGQVQYVFLMKPKGKPSGGYLHGYFFFSNRAEVERLISFSGRLFFDRYRIRYEEFKSTIPGKRQKVKKTAITKKLQTPSIQNMEKEHFSLFPKEKGDDFETLPNLTSCIEIGSLPGRQRPFLSSCLRVAQNQKINDNLRFNILTGQRPRPQPYAGISASLLAGHQNPALKLSK